VFKLGVRKQFNAAHVLEAHPGKCARLHGHTWEVEVVLEGKDTDPSGMLVDFEEVAGALERAVSDLDHAYLNELAPFSGLPPTAENVARLVYERIAGEAETGSWDAALSRVTVWESRDNWASFSDG
jgi:6-pyruvoyltetrahydropterin/6-carboxytetrahydropterin synthase